MKKYLLAVVGLSNISSTIAQVTVSLAYCPTPTADTGLNGGGNETIPSTTT